MDETPQPIPQQPQIVPPVIMHKKNYLLLVGAIVFLALVILAAVIFFAVRDNKGQSTNTPPTTVSKSSPSSVLPTSVPIETKTPQENATWSDYKSSKLIGTSFSAYSFSYPPTWTKDHQNDGTTDALVLTNGDYTIKIFQSPTEANQCIYEDPIPTGNPFIQDLRGKKFTEIKIDAGTLRRTSKLSQNTFTNYEFCMATPTTNGAFSMPTAFGFITYTGPKVEDAQKIAEMDSIIKTLKAL